MKILVVGGAGFIGTGISEYAAKSGHEVTAVTRNKHTWHEVTNKINAVRLDWNNYNDVAAFMNNKYYDVIVDGLIWNEKMMKRDLSLFKERCGHFFFISSAGVYNQPCFNITEDEPIDEKDIYWEVMKNKRKAELYLEKEWDNLSFITTVIRPSITYGDTRIPGGILSRKNQMTLIQRIISRKPIILADDNGARHPITRIDVFSKAVISLFAKSETHRQYFHISDEVSYTWDEVISAIGNALNISVDVVHINVNKIKRYDRILYKEVKYNKFDNLTLDIAKIKRYVPEVNYHTDLVDDFKKIIPNIMEINKDKPLDDKFNIISDLLIDDYRKNGNDKEEKKVACDYYATLSNEYLNYIKAEEKKITRNEMKKICLYNVKAVAKKLLPSLIVEAIKR